MRYIIRRAESLYNNSARIFDIEKIKAADLKKKAAAEAARKAKENLINADDIDDEN